VKPPIARGALGATARSFERVAAQHDAHATSQTPAPAPSLAGVSRRKRYTRNLGRRLRVPLPRSEEWVRFEHELEGFGVFSYLSDARRRGSTRLAARIDRLRAWFNLWLDAPSDDVRIDNEKFWFRAEAAEHLERARRLADLVSRAGFPIRELRVIQGSKPVRWQDAHQLAVSTGKSYIEPEGS
jgi:hypothetical protein